MNIKHKSERVKVIQNNILKSNYEQNIIQSGSIYMSFKI